MPGGLSFILSGMIASFSLCIDRIVSMFDVFALWQDFEMIIAVSGPTEKYEYLWNSIN